MLERPEDADSLRGLAARLRALAAAEPKIADRLRAIADETDNHAEIMATRRSHRPRID